MTHRLLSIHRRFFFALVLLGASSIALANETQVSRHTITREAYMLSAYVDGHLVAGTTVAIPDSTKLLSRADFHTSGSSISWDDCDLRQPGSCSSDIPDVEFEGRVEEKDGEPIHLLVRVVESVVNPIDLTTTSRQSLSYDDYVSVRPGETWVYREGPHLSVTVQRLPEQQSAASTSSSLGYYGVDSLPAGAHRVGEVKADPLLLGDAFASTNWIIGAAHDGQ